MGSYHRSPTGRRPRTAPLSWRRGPGQLCPHSNLAPGVWMSKPRLALEQRRGSWIGDPRVGAGAPGGVEVGYNKASLAEPQVPGCGTPPLHPHPHGGTGWDVQVHSLDKKSGNLRELGAWPGPRLGDVCVCWGGGAKCYRCPQTDQEGFLRGTASLHGYVGPRSSSSQISVSIPLLSRLVPGLLGPEPPP